LPKLKIVCAWCGKELGEKEGPEGTEGTTPGICDDCLFKNFPHHYAKIKGILEVPSIDDIYKEPNEVRCYSES